MAVSFLRTARQPSSLFPSSSSSSASSSSGTSTEAAATATRSAYRGNPRHSLRATAKSSTPPTPPAATPTGEPAGKQPDQATAAAKQAPPRFQSATSRPEAQHSTSDTDLAFRKRLAIQRASTTWGPLLAVWFDSPSAIRGDWTLPALQEAIRSEAARLATAATPEGGDDERLRLAFEAMLVRGVTGVLRQAIAHGQPLSPQCVTGVGQDLIAMVEEPPVHTLRTSKGDPLHVRGKTSLAISFADIGSRLLPALARHAGVATRQELGEALELLHTRARHLAAEVLGPGGSEKEHQSLTQSFLKREAEILAVVLERLPPAGPGAYAQANRCFSQALESYLRLSTDLHRTILDLVDGAPPHPASPSPDEKPAMCSP